MARYNFTDITLASKANITEVMDNFNKIENNGAIVDDLPKVFSVTFTAANWVKVDGGYQYTLSNSNIKAEPYIIDVIFNNLAVIKSPINPKADSQAEGSIILITAIKPTVDLSAKLVITRGIV